MRQVWSKVSSCRRSAADCSCGILVCGKSGAKFHPAADCSCGILVCGKSAAKFHPAADLPQTVPVAYWYAASLQQNFFLPHTSAYSLPQTKSLRQVCGRSAAYFSLSYGNTCLTDNYALYFLNEGRSFANLLNKIHNICYGHKCSYKSPCSYEFQSS